MVEINYDYLRGELFKYVDKDALVAELKAAGAKDLNPFKYNNVGVPVGFSEALLNVKGMSYLLLEYSYWLLEKICADAGEIGAGKEKRKALVQILDNAVKCNPVLELVDGKIIGIAVDFLVDGMNKKYGKDWIKHMPHPTLAGLPAPAAPPEPPAVEDEKEPEPEKSGAKKGKSK